VGSYKLSVTATGFKTLDRSGIVLTVMQEANLNLTLDVGASSETVTVTSDVPLVNLGSSVLGATITNVEVDNLPLVSRDTYQLLSLTPGVQGVGAPVPQNTLGYQEYHVYINGSTDDLTGQVAYYLDGGLNMTGLRNSGNVVPNPDAIREFNVQTNNFSAQLGRYSAAVISVVTKSGTNAFHGSAFYFYRDKNFNAVQHNTSVKVPYTRQQFGGTVGGPIRRDRDFFFASLGALRFDQGTNYTGNVPSAAQRKGNFQENLATDITTCAQSPSAADNAAFKFLVCNPATHTPYANNIITTALDPTASNILANLTDVPLPNPTQATDTPYTHRETAPVPENNSEYLGKTDHVRGNHRITFSYFLYNHDIRSVPSTLTQHWSYSDYKTRQMVANASDVWTVTPNMVNQFYVNYTRQNGGRTNLPAISLASFGSDFGVVGTPSLPNISISNWFTLGQAIQGPKAGTNLYGIRDVLSLTKGKHTFYFGGEEGLEKDFQQTSLNNYGTFSYSTTANTRSNQSISDFVLGIPATMNQDVPEYANANYWNTGLFAQDDWRIVPRLTVNIGVRYDIQRAPTDTQQRETNFLPGVQSTAFTTVTVNAVPGVAPIGMLFPGDPGVPSTGAFTPYNHVSPRLGFAYDPYGNGKTVFHGAAGVFFGGISGNEWEIPSNFQPYAVRASFSKVVSMTHPYSTDTSEFPGGVNPFPNFQFIPGSHAATFIKPVQESSIAANYKWPYDYQINFGVQQQFGRSFALSVNYVASLNRKLPLYTDLNPPQFNITAANTSGASCTNLALACGYANTSSTVNNRRPLNSMYGLSAASPTYSNVYNIRSNQNSNYNGVQVNVTQRLTHHLSANGYYIWSKTLASNSLDTSALTGTFVDPNYPQLEGHQRATVDTRHQAVGSLVWKPDYFDGRSRLLRETFNGWTVTSIISLNSGTPFTVTTGTDVNGDGQTNDRPSIVPGQHIGLINNGGSRVAMMAQWFNTAAYCVPNNSTCQGTGPLNLLGLTRPAELSGPGYRDIDASVFRDFTVYREMRFQIRGEATNVFNLTNLGQPNATMNNAQFGKITGTNGSNRILQIGGRILF
jgi:outer membrane receptor protein involved in Fe transport